MSFAITETSAGYEVAFKYDPVKVSAIKQIVGAYFLPEKKVWVIHKRKNDELKRLIARFTKRPEGDYSAMPVQVDMMPTEKYEIDKTLPELTIDIPLKKTLRDYQKNGVAYAIEKKSCIMGDQQGTGKTIQAIAAVIAQNAFPCLVICKSSLMQNWDKEWKDWSNKKSIIFRDAVHKTWPVVFQTGFANVGICSYESLKKYFTVEINKPGKGEDFKVKHIVFREAIKMFKSIIIDESHYIKDGKTLRTKLCIGLSKGKENVYLLTGTPVLNDPTELYPQLVALGKSYLFGSLEKFKELYGKDSKRQRESLPFLNYLLHKNCYFRRIKSDVAKDIPPKTRQVILCEIDNRAEYDQAERNFKKFLESSLDFTQGQIDKKLRAEALVKIMELKKIAARGKLKDVYEWVTDLLEEDEKVVVFGHHKEITKSIKAHFPGAVSILGDDANDIRQRNKEKFMSDPETKVIVCSIGAAAEGHTLTAASNLGLTELPWHFGKAEQCEDRIHRIGQDMPVTITYFLGDNTIDRKIYDLIMEKKDIHDMITGTDEEVDERVVDKLINLFNQK